MTSTVIGQFETRRSAELAIERIVQEYGVSRDEVHVRPSGSENTAGTRPAGADAKSTPDQDHEGKLEGLVEVVVELNTVASELIVAAMKAAGATDVRNA